MKVAKRGITEVTEYNEKEVEARYGFAPSKLPDFKGLIGDKSDNIPGVPGIGEKTACRLIAEYGDLENILAHVNELKPKEQKLLRDASEQARQSKYLATIVLNVPVQLDLAACDLTYVDSTKVFTLFRQLEFRTLVDRVRTLLRELGIAESSTNGVASTGSEEGDKPKGGNQSMDGDKPTDGNLPANGVKPRPYSEAPIGIVPIILPPFPPGASSLSVRAGVSSASTSVATATMVGPARTCDGGGK